jgi:putative membrane protein
MHLISGNRHGEQALVGKPARSRIMNLLKTMIIAGAAAGVAASGAPAALAQATMTEPPDRVQQAAAASSDADFIRKAVAGNRYEIEAGQLAVVKATDRRLKDFAGTMIIDHTAALEKLEEIARAAGTPVPASAGLDATQQAKIETLKGLSDAAFDQQYKAEQKQAHENTMALLLAYKEDGKDAKLRAWAAEALLTVVKHREALNAL